MTERKLVQLNFEDSSYNVSSIVFNYIFSMLSLVYFTEFHRLPKSKIYHDCLCITMLKCDERYGFEESKSKMHHDCLC